MYTVWTHNCRYHLGTLAFGALILAICRMIRIMLEYIDQKLKKYDNPVTRAIMCCLKCCFYCLEKFIKFINRNAYIMCAVHGKNFCASAKDAFNLLMRNLLRTFILDKVVSLFCNKCLGNSSSNVKPKTYQKRKKQFTWENKFFGTRMNNI